MRSQGKSIASLDPQAALRLAAFQTKKQKAATSDDPLDWATLAIPHVTFWSKQLEIINAVKQFPRVAVRACHDSSKSFTAAVIAAQWIDQHPVGTARVITTAPTGMQVKGILWVEINQLHSHPNTSFPGRVNQTEWWVGNYLCGVGRKPADYRPEAFSGLHARYPLIIIDEASGVPRPIIDAAETLATNVHARVLMIGNPDDPSSLFAEIHNDPDKFGFHTIRIAAWDTPNFTGEPVTEELSELLLSKQWVEQRRKAWGIDHPFWRSKVEAEFPSVDLSSIIKLVDLIAARVPFAERPINLIPSDGGVGSENGHPVQPAPPSPIQTPQPPQTICLGVDVAGSDDGDETVVRQVIATQSNPQTATATNEWRIRSSDPAKLADFIVDTIIWSHANKVVIDSIGVGFGIIGAVKQHLKLPRNVVVEGFSGATSPADKAQYGNARAELWWLARQAFQNGQIDTSVADNQTELEAQLIMPRYKIYKGKIYVEAKDEIKQRLGRSPDNADAFMYALYSMLSSGTIKVASPLPAGPVTQSTTMVKLTQRHATQTRAARLPVRRSA